MNWLRLLMHWIIQRQSTPLTVIIASSPRIGHNRQIMTVITNKILKFKPMPKTPIVKNFTFFAAFTFNKINFFAYINTIIMQHL